MKVLHGKPAPNRRGAALLLSLLILLVLVAIVIQINVGTSTDARVARNDVGLTSMDLAIESAFLQEYETLRADGEAGASAGGDAGAAGAAANPSAGGTPALPGAPGAGQQQATDSRRDEWSQVQRTEINEIKLRVYVQDEDAKLNVLNLLNSDEKEAEAAFDRVVRCLDLCREGTTGDISERAAQDMTRAMFDFMRERSQSKLPRPTLLTDDENHPDVGLPLALRDFAVLPHFDESFFRDYRDEDGRVVHSIGSFLTVWTSLTTKAGEDEEPAPGPPAAAPTAPEGGASGDTGGGTGGGTGNPSAGGSGAQGSGAGSGSGSGSGTGGTGTPAGNPTGTPAAGAQPGAASTPNPGWGVNVNTAPVAVLKSLFDDRDVHPRLWDKVVEYRNLEEEPEDGEEDEETEPMYDEFGEEILERQIFDALSELAEVDGFNDLDANTQTKIKERLTTQSQVFSIFVVARRTTSAEGDMNFGRTAAETRRMEEEQGDALVRVARSVVWRRVTDDEVEIVPIVRWEWVDYLPLEVLDYPDDER